MGQDRRARSRIAGVAQRGLENPRGNPVAELGPVGGVSGRGVGVGEGDGVGYLVVFFGGGVRGGERHAHVVQRDGGLVVEVVWSQGVAQLGVRPGRPGGVQAEGREEVVDD